MPSSLDASEVMEVVLNKYEQYLPAGLAPKVRSMNPARIFRILPENQYKPYFAAVFRNFFAAVNVSALGMRVIEVANSPASPYDQLACPAFCAPAVNVVDRTIYINRDSGVTVGTLYHEFVHYLSHSNFYPEFYALGGKNPSILEGVTEYLTRRIAAPVAHDRYNQQKYQTWFTQVSRDMGGNPTTTLQRLAALAFQGDFSVVLTLGRVAPRL
jgi:hypothetical protein